MDVQLHSFGDHLGNERCLSLFESDASGCYFEPKEFIHKAVDDRVLITDCLGFIVQMDNDGFWINKCG